MEDDTQEFAVGEEAGHGRSEPEAVSPMVPSVAGAGDGLYAAIAAARRARRERPLVACIGRTDRVDRRRLGLRRPEHLSPTVLRHNVHRALCITRTHTVQLARLLVEPEEAHRQAHSLLPRRTHLM